MLTALFLSTYPVRGTTIVRGLLRAQFSISIHVPRAGYDFAACTYLIDLEAISIHVPRAGYDMENTDEGDKRLKFLSTYPVRGTTRCQVFCVKKIEYFYPRTPCGVRPRGAADYRGNVRISIHVPRAGYDACNVAQGALYLHFYPRTPCGVRHMGVDVEAVLMAISIHVPRAGYDEQIGNIAQTDLNFYPRTPCGVRPSPPIVGISNIVISIHVPRAGYDSKV